MPVGCNSCAAGGHHADLEDVLGTCRREASDTSPGAADVGVGVGSPYLPKMKLMDVEGTEDSAVP